jgi:Cu+-exporting ATPase
LGLVNLHMSQLEKRGRTAVIATIVSAAGPAASSAPALAPQAFALAVLGVADELKPEARAVVRTLSRRMGLEVWMITGDHRTTALALAKDVGIPEERVLAEALPADKAAKVKALCELGRGGVAFVGDGINDAPALARATVGVALGAGSKIAIAAAKVVLVKSDLWDVVCALDLSKVVFRRIQLNFLWALGYNVLALPIAAGAFFPLAHAPAAPEAAGLAMAFSSVSVVVSSLLLQLYRRPRADGDGAGRGGNGSGASSGGSGSGALRRRHAATVRAVASEDEEGEEGDESVALRVRDRGDGGGGSARRGGGEGVVLNDLRLVASRACACSCTDCACEGECANEVCGGGGGGGGCCSCGECRCTELRAPSPRR